MKKMLLILAVACLFAHGCKTTEEEEPGIKVLMIGNSFSQSCMVQLPAVAKERGVELDLTSLCIGGCSLQRHWQNYAKPEEATKPYWVQRNRFGVETSGHISLPDALRLRKWDIITIQQASGDSWRPESYQPYASNLLAEIRQLCPDARIYVQETWSYTPWDGRLKRWKIYPHEMYEKLRAAYEELARQESLGIIRMGDAVEKWRERLPVVYTENSFGGDVVGGGRLEERDHFKRSTEGHWMPNSDVMHLNPRGEYLQALVWAAELFGVDLAEMEYRPECVSESDAKLMREIAMEVSSHN